MEVDLCLFVEQVVGGRGKGWKREARRAVGIVEAAAAAAASAAAAAAAASAVAATQSYVDPSYSCHCPRSCRKSSMIWKTILKILQFSMHRSVWRQMNHSYPLNQHP